MVIVEHSEAIADHAYGPAQWSDSFDEKFILRKITAVHPLHSSFLKVLQVKPECRKKRGNKKHASPLSESLCLCLSRVL